MTISEILTTDSANLVANLRSAFNGVYVDETYKGRDVFLKKWDTGYEVILSDPNERKFFGNANEAIEFLKSSLM